MPQQTFFNLPAEKRQMIIDIALAEFGENDYQNASVRRIVSAAGIAHGSFYQYFADKEDLYRYLFELAAQEKGRFLSTPPPEPQMDIFAYLRWLTAKGVEFELAHPELSKVGYRALRDNTFPHEFITQAKTQGLVFFQQLIAQAQAQGDIDPAVDSDLAAFIFQVIFTELGSYIFERMQAAGAEMDARPGRPSFMFSDEAHDMVTETIRILEQGLRQREE